MECPIVSQDISLPSIHSGFLKSGKSFPSLGKPGNIESHILVNHGGHTVISSLDFLRQKSLPRVAGLERIVQPKQPCKRSHRYIPTLLGPLRGKVVHANQPKVHVLNLTAVIVWLFGSLHVTMIL